MIYLQTICTTCPSCGILSRGERFKVRSTPPPLTPWLLWLLLRALRCAPTIERVVHAVKLIQLKRDHDVKLVQLRLQ